MYISTRITPPSNKGFCQVKKNPKIREKLGSGWVGQAPNGIIIIFWKFCVFCVFFVCFMCCFHVSKKKKKLDSWVGGLCLTNPSFSRIFGFLLT